MGMTHKGFDIHKEINLSMEINIGIKAVMAEIKFIAFMIRNINGDGDGSSARMEWFMEEGIC